MLFACALALPGAVVAQNAASEADRRVQEMITRHKDQTGLRDHRCRLSSRLPEEIVACGAVDPTAHRLTPGGDPAPMAGDGRPRAPAVSGRGTPSERAQPSTYFIDLESLPPDPPGSDAARIGSGEIERP